MNNLNVGMNRLSNSGAIAIIKNSPKTLLKLDLSKNNLGLPTYQLLADYLDDYSRKLIFIFPIILVLKNSILKEIKEEILDVS